MIDTQRQTLIERFDTKISTHISAIVAITFGAFTVLTFLEGKASQLENLHIWYLLFIEAILFPLGIFYCLCRAFYYSRAAEETKDETLGNMEDVAGRNALEEMPLVVKKLVDLRLKLHPPQIVWIILLPYALWILLICVVLIL